MRAILFAAIGTAGQRCTSLCLLERAYSRGTVGGPREPGTLVGPLIDQGAFAGMQRALETAQAQGIVFEVEGQP